MTEPADPGPTWTAVATDEAPWAFVLGRPVPPPADALDFFCRRYGVSARVFRGDPNPTPVPEGDPMFERFTDRARKVMMLAAQEAQRFNHDRVDTQHVLVGLVKEGSGVAAHALTALLLPAGPDGHPDPANAVGLVRRTAERLFPRWPTGDQTTFGVLPRTPGCDDLVRRALDAADRRGHARVGTEHLLLGLLAQDPDTPANRVLAALGVRLVDLEAEVDRLLGPGAAGEGEGVPGPGWGPAGPAHAADCCPSGLPAKTWTLHVGDADGDLDSGLPVPGDPFPDRGPATADVLFPGTQFLHRVRGRDYTDESLRLAVKAALRVAAHEPAADDPMYDAAAAFLTDLFGGPAR